MTTAVHARHEIFVKVFSCGWENTLTNMSKRVPKPVKRFDPADYPTDDEEGEDLDAFLEEDNAEESEEEESDLDGFIVSDDEDAPPREQILAIARQIMTRPLLGFATSAEEAAYFRMLAEKDDEADADDDDVMSEEEEEDDDDHYYYYYEEEEDDEDYEPSDDEDDEGTDSADDSQTIPEE